MATFGERLKLLRTEKKLSQHALADLIGIERATYGKYERNESQAPDITKKKLADFFDVSIDYLCGYADFKLFTNYFTSNNDLYVEIPFIENILPNKKIASKYIMTPKEKLPGDNCFYIKSPDSYVTERIDKNDTLLIHEQDFFSSEDIMLVNIHGKNYIKKLYTNGSNYLAFNPSDRELFIIEKKELIIIGKVLEVSFSLTIQAGAVK